VLTRGLPIAEVRRRLPRLLAGLVLLGLGIALMVEADLGLSPWDVLHQGLGELLGLPIGTAGILVGVLVLLAWIPLGERVGLGTVFNIAVVGIVIDVALAAMPDLSTGARWAALVLGAFAMGPAVALYLSCDLGAGPRDGLMTALVARGWSLRVVRTAMEVAVLVAGYALGGTVGVGTVLFAVTVGPNIHYFVGRLPYGQLSTTPSSNT
jgi:uncharacterized membrane protein YczE